VTPIPTEHLRKHLAATLAEVADGATFVVTRRGKPLAILSPPEPTTAQSVLRRAVRVGVAVLKPNADSPRSAE